MGQKNFAKSVLKFTNLFPATANEPTWVNSVADWAQKRITGANERIEATRNKEINRLLELLERDPDEGLKYALPLGGEPGRGQADPGAFLHKRDLSYRFGGWRTSGAIDGWALNPTYQYKLREKYMESAQREEQLGRYQRAAYIYANLLNDFRAAAQVLQRGGFYMEAAQLFEEKCNDHIRAAECYCQSGLFHEAAKRYEQNKRFDDAAAAWEKSGDKDEARKCWEQHILLLLRQQDLIAASIVIRDRLDEPGRALTLLISAWPNHPQAEEALSRELTFRMKDGMLADAQHRVLSLLRSRLSNNTLKQFMRVLSHHAILRGDREFHDETIDTLRIRVGEMIKHDAKDARGLVRGLAALDTQDQLFNRDCMRYRSTVSITADKSGIIVNDGDHFEVTSHEPFRLPDRLDWVFCSSNAVGLFAAGLSPNGKDMTLIRKSWNEEQTAAASMNTWDNKAGKQLKCFPFAQTSPIFAEGMSNQVMTWYSAVGDAVQPSLTFATTTHLPELHAVPMPASSKERTIYALAHGEHQQLWCCYDDSGGVWLERWHEGSERQYAIMIQELVGHDAKLVVVRSTPCLAYASTLLFVNPGEAKVEDWERMELPHPVRKIVGVPHTARERLLVCMEQGVMYVYKDSGVWQHQLLAAEINQPMAAFIGNAVVVAANGYGQVYLRHETHLRKRATWEPPPGEILNIVREKTNRRYAVITIEGVVQIYELPHIV